MLTSFYNSGNDLPSAMEPLYYIQVEDIEAPLENKLRLLIDWGGLKALGRKGLKDLKGSKDLKNLKRLKDLEAMKGSQAGVKVARRKEHKPGSFFTRSQLLHFWRTNKRPERQRKMGRWTTSTKISGDGSLKRKGTESWSSIKKKNKEGWSSTKKKNTGGWSGKESGGGGLSAKRAFGRFPERWSADSEERDWMEEEEEEPLPEYQHSQHSHHSQHTHRSQHTQPLPEYQRSPPPSAEAKQVYKYTSSTNAQRAAQQVRMSQFYKFSLPRYHHRLIS